jgi:hypothetical protein
VGARDPEDPAERLHERRLEQPPLVGGRHDFAVAICYEDIFGAEMIDALPAAQVLLNVSNSRGSAIARAEQHLQDSQMRALETGAGWCARPTPASRRRSTSAGAWCASSAVHQGHARRIGHAAIGHDALRALGELRALILVAVIASRRCARFAA